MIGELYRQLQEGWDFDDAAELLDPISGEEASRPVPGAPYTILQNLAHAEVWQSYWLRASEGEVPRPEQEWPAPAPGEWETVRRSFLEGLARAASLAAGDPGPSATTRLIQIALHTSYHLGQIQLLRRMLEE